MDMKLVGRFMAAFACTAALAAAGCDNTANRDRSSATAGDASAGTNQPVSLTGCLARGEGSNDFILTKANQPVATSGTAAGAGSVEHKTMEAAARSYRLDGNNDELDKLVGHEILVSGTLAYVLAMLTVERIVSPRDIEAFVRMLRRESLRGRRDAERTR